MAQIVAYALLIDGIPTVFTTSEDVTHAHVAAWGFLKAYPGLQFPQRLPASVDLRSGVPQMSSATFQIHDIDGELPSLFAASWDDVEEIQGVYQIQPLEDPAPSVVWGKCVGTETIGPAGERRRYSCVPGFNVGMWHVAGPQASAAGLGAAPVSDLPVVWAGRRVCLHRIVWDGSAWSDLTVAHTRDSTRVWYGTLLAQGDVEGRVWSLQCAGPESWAGGTVGLGFPAGERPIDVETLLNEEANEHVLYGTLKVINLFDHAETAYTYVGMKVDSTSLAGVTTYDGLVSGFQTFLAAMADDASSGQRLTDAGVSDLTYYEGPGDVGVGVRFDRDLSAAPKVTTGDTLLLLVRAHEKVWKRLGYDPATQNDTIDAVEHPEKYGRFLPVEDPPGYWLGRFYAAAPSAMLAADEGAAYDFWEPDVVNYANWRIWPPIYGQGASYFDLSQTPQILRVNDLNDLWLPPLNYDLPTDPNDPDTTYSIPGVGTVTHTGLVAFTGPYRDETDPEAEVKTISIPAIVSWNQQSDGTVAKDSDGKSTLVVWEWPDPREYGMGDTNPTVWGAWRIPPEEDGQPLTIRPLWRWMGSAANKSGVGETIKDLLSTSVLGLGVPGSFGGMSDYLAGLGECVAATGKPVSARELVKTLVAPMGWVMGMTSSGFFLFDPYRFDHTNPCSLDPEDYAGDPGDPAATRPAQRLRVLAPIDAVTLKARVNPVDGKYLEANYLPSDIRSSDSSVVYRGQTVTHSVDAPHLPHPAITPWVNEYHTRWSEITRWWAKQHFELKVEVSPRYSEQMWPGLPVEFTDPWLVNPTAGVYGVSSARGYVVARNFNAAKERLEVTCIVEAAKLLLYAPAALAKEYRPDTDAEGYRIFVEDDYLGFRAGTGTRDVDGFVEPSWSTAGGNADIEVFSFDGVSWTGGIYGTVENINSEEGNCWIKLTGALTGATWLRDQWHIVVLRDAENQSAAWPFEVYAPLGNKSGNYTGTTKTKKFKDA